MPHTQQKGWRFAALFYMARCMEKTFHLPSDKKTRSFGAALATILQPGDVLALHGGLGAGKTTMTRGLIQFLLGEEEEVPSPTYTLVQIYETDAFPIWHFDLYRLESPEDLHELGWDETDQGVAILEWPDKAGDQLPAWRLDVHLEFDGDQRIVRLVPCGEDWQTRLDDFRF